MVVCNLAQIALEKRTNITKVSVEAGINRDTLSRLVNSRIKGLEFTTITALCSYLKVEIGELFSVYPFDVSNIIFELDDEVFHSGEGYFDVEWVLYSPKPSNNYFEGRFTMVEAELDHYDLYLQIDDNFASSISAIPPMALNAVKRMFELAFMKQLSGVKSVEVTFDWEK